MNYLTDEIVLMSKNWLQIQQETQVTVKSIADQLMVLQTAYPTTTRNYSKSEYKAMLGLWYSVFSKVPEDTMREAIRRYIINDRKGFFPVPGQIVGYIEQIVSEQNAAQEARENYLELSRLNGEIDDG